MRYDPSMADQKPQPVSDPRILRAIAHPVRNRILDELSATGPMRAVDVANSLGIPANQASFHLRQLAKYGLVAEAPEEARDGRDRVWRAVHEAGLNVDIAELAKSPGGKAAVTVFRREWTATAHDAVERAEFAERQKDALVMVSDSAIRLTKADAQELAAALNDLVESWRVRGKSAAAEARTYQLLQILQPARDIEA
jgi:predicted ArsR family transcriptional regulator